MEDLSKHQPSSDSASSSSEVSKDRDFIAYRLRDREMLRKKKAEAQEKDSTEWVLRMCKNKQQKRGRQTKRGRGRQTEGKANLDPEPTTDPRPVMKKKAEPVHSEPALPEPMYSEPVLPEPVYSEPPLPEPVYSEPPLPEPVYSEPPLPEPVYSEPPLPEPLYQEQLPMLTIQNPVSGMQPVAAEGEPAARSLDPAGEEEVVKPTEADILEVFNAPLENDHQDNEFNAHLLY